MQMNRKLTLQVLLMKIQGQVRQPLLLILLCIFMFCLIYSPTLFFLVLSETLNKPEEQPGQLDDTFNECFNSEQGTIIIVTLTV